VKACWKQNNKTHLTIWLTHIFQNSLTQCFVYLCHKLTRPEKVLFVDEVGENTSQKQDGHIGGWKLVVVHGTRSQERNCYNDAYVTVLGFTATSGEPVMCVAIDPAKYLNAFEAAGFKPLSDDMDEPGSLEEKSMKDKYKRCCDCLFPGGPVYIFLKGKKYQFVHDVQRMVPSQVLLWLQF
jgi:hypothetical protein